MVLSDLEMDGTMENSLGSKPLQGRVAVVTGASRGIGRGVALGLGEAGATVYVAARSTDASRARGSIEETADHVTAAGGRGAPITCDFADESQIRRLFEQVVSNEGRVDILVNSAFAIGAKHGRDLYRPFWELDTSVWDAMHTIGLRSNYLASAYAAREMIKRSSGLIVHISSFGSVRYHFNVPYHAGKAGLDKMTADMGYELRPYGVAVLSLWPGLVLTEGVEKATEFFDVRKADSPLFLGRIVAALAADPDTVHKSGMAWGSFELGRDLKIRDPVALND
jgi:dehydrogenase/reductase SDR family protein 1